MQSNQVLIEIFLNKNSHASQHTMESTNTGICEYLREFETEF
jgi:hypothetical protein